ncbi:MAG: ABC transporter ATP-binding protein [Longimicrobiales bacterium]|nr:ABC transporter ATP-binding protein [Longimicrobiales bacterium]
MSAPVLELRGVTIPFGEATGASAPGLRDLDLVLEEGERFALVGASGAGKSSLLAAIAEPRPGVTGSIRIAGREFGGTVERRHTVVLLDQRPLLFPHLDVRRNVAFPLEVRGIRGEELDRGVERALDVVRMADFADRRPDSLSGGQAHRVALARAIAASPALLLLDEPFTGLDPELRRSLQETVREVTAHREITTLTVTHDVEEAGRMADRVGALHDGRLARVAPPAVLFEDPGSLGVARLIGWPNELPVVSSPGEVTLGGRALDPPPRRGAGVADGPAVLTFSRHGAEIVSEGEGHLTIEVERVTHAPHGATLHWTGITPRDPAAPPTTSRSRTLAPRPERGEVAVESRNAPQVGTRVGLRLRLERCRVYSPETPER